MLELDFSKFPNGLLPVVTQDWQTKEVLMVAFINQEAWQKTLDSNLATYWSRSRKKLWVKGESSGNTQNIKEILVDCDQDTVIYKVEQIGGVSCHKGYRSCFYRKIENGEAKFIAKPIIDPKKLYRNNN